MNEKEELLMTIKELQKRKKELGLTYQEIADRSGLPLGTVQKVLGGITKSPRLKTVEALASVLTATASDVPLSTGDHVSPAAGSLLKEAPASYGAYIHGSAAEKNTIGVYPMLPHKRQGEYTASDRDSLPEDVRTELIDGVLYDMTAPVSIHQIILGALYTQLQLCIEKSGKDCLLMMSPSDVWLDGHDKTIVQPDLYVICDYKMLDLYGHTSGAPPFVVEILSLSTESRDRGIKLTKYSAAGVQEYWIIDPYKERILVYLFDRESPDTFEPIAYTFTDTVPVSISRGSCEVDFRRISSLISRISK